jgi:ubiquinone/menaquinone biosynthesis C-methylase UbiE
MKEQRDFWDKKVGKYERLNRNHIKKIEKINGLLRLNKSDSVLEVGIGTGVHAKYILDKNNVKFTGIDVSLEMLKRSGKYLDGYGVSLVSADGIVLPFRDGSFDAVFCNATLHHLVDPFTGLKEMHRVTKKGGRIVVMEPNLWFPKNLFQALFIPVERNNLQITRKNFSRWSRELKLRDIVIENFIFTIPFPRFMFGVYDRIDDLLQEVPILRNLSIQLIMSGKKR